ncbi:nickel pincer cofactor biosynthesis protein LarB [Holophaga foetida]|uniref:nickel pincer cofactor biosynthesis protein LarB n=1 Tax=Holophaga foetida TaxID=35839 RepID=UPI0002471814|nr:nickel pincer cofactor biosynthesis protein LarB [Holophaga foetida]
MEEEKLRQLLREVREGRLSEEAALEGLRELPFADLGYAKLDMHRGLRRGQAEVIFCQGKTPEQTQGIFQKMLGHLDNVLGTRASREAYEAVAQVAPDATWHPEAKIIQVRRSPQEPAPGVIAVVTAGTSDIPVAEEAALTAEFLGNRVERLFDVGVAGIHRLLAHREQLERASVIIAVAGMEGALPSVVAGLVPCPVVAVPTSVGYGASFGGVAALLAMLNSCASGVGVVNIDNGYGAAALASLINRRPA